MIHRSTQAYHAYCISAGPPGCVASICNKLGVGSTCQCVREGEWQHVCPHKWLPGFQSGCCHGCVTNSYMSALIMIIKSLTGRPAASQQYDTVVAEEEKCPCHSVLRKKSMYVCVICNIWMIFYDVSWKVIFNNFLQTLGMIWAC